MKNTEMLYTIISGVVVYVICELFVEFILRPIQEYKRLRGKVAYFLVQYACYYLNPQSIVELRNSPGWKDAGDETRKLSSEVAACAEIKPHAIFVWYSIPRKKSLQVVSKSLMGLSNSYFAADGCKSECQRGTLKFVETIKRVMKIAV